MRQLRAKFLGKPVGIWAVLVVHIAFVGGSLFFHPVLFPHAMEFMRHGLFAQLFSTPAAALVFVGIVFSCTGIVGLLARRLWGLIDSYVALAMMATLVLAFVHRGLGILLALPPLAVAALGLLANRRWFDERL